jgi:hypothetical protein
MEGVKRVGTIDPDQTGCYTEHGVSGYGVAVKLSRGEPMNDAFVKQMAETMMLAIAEKCLELGARCIGHIKSHWKTEAGTIKADTIGIAHGAYSSGGLSQPVKELFLAINSIVQGIPEEAVKAATLEGLHEVSEQRGLLVVKEMEHTYFDTFDFVTSKKDFVEELKQQLDNEPPDEKEPGI